MRTSARRGYLIATAVLALWACGGSDDDSTGSTTPANMAGQSATGVGGPSMSAGGTSAQASAGTAATATAGATAAAGTTATAGTTGTAGTAATAGTTATAGSGGAGDDSGGTGVRTFPSHGATGVNPDTHLLITFDSPPAIGDAGKIRVYDTQSNELVDTLDMSIAAGPNPSLTIANREKMEREAAGLPEPEYQQMTIGGLEGFHFHPVIVHDNTAAIDLHSHVLDYGRTYRVEIDASALVHADFKGVSSSDGWTFTTKAAPPDASATALTVAADGSGDFNTLQAAIEFVPDTPRERVTINIKKGNYEEIVFFRNKSKITIRGEERDTTVVGYGNNSSFNAGRNGVSYRQAFTAQSSNDIQLSNFTINNYYVGQAEALKMTGQRNFVERMTLDGSGDALTLTGTTYLVDSKLLGDGDSILSYGAAFFERCELRSIGPLQWIRNPAGNHGHVFKDCTIVGLDEPLPWTVTDANPAGEKPAAVLARLPNNGGTNYPYAEFVLIDTRMSGIVPEGVVSIESQATFDWSNVHFWEHHTLNLDGTPLDLSKRHPIMRELKAPQDASLIENYSNPAFVLGGWTPVIDPG